MLVLVPSWPASSTAGASPGCPFLCKQNTESKPTAHQQGPYILACWKALGPASYARPCSQLCVGARAQQASVQHCWGIAWLPVVLHTIQCVSECSLAARQPHSARQQSCVCKLWAGHARPCSRLCIDARAQQASVQHRWRLAWLPIPLHTAHLWVCCNLAACWCIVPCRRSVWGVQSLSAIHARPCSQLCVDNGADQQTSIKHRWGLAWLPIPLHSAEHVRACNLAAMLLCCAVQGELLRRPIFGLATPGHAADIVFVPLSSRPASSTAGASPGSPFLCTQRSLSESSNLRACCYVKGSGSCSPHQATQPTCVGAGSQQVSIQHRWSIAWLPISLHTAHQIREPTAWQPGVCIQLCRHIPWGNPGSKASAHCHAGRFSGASGPLGRLCSLLQPCRASQDLLSLLQCGLQSTQQQHLGLQAALSCVNLPESSTGCSTASI